MPLISQRLCICPQGRAIYILTQSMVQTTSSDCCWSASMHVLPLNAATYDGAPHSLGGSQGPCSCWIPVSSAFTKPSAITTSQSDAAPNFVPHLCLAPRCI